MPAFGSPFAELANPRKLTDPELVRAIRFKGAKEVEELIKDEYQTKVKPH